MHPTYRGDEMLEGLVQDFQLTLPYFLRRAEQLYWHREIVTRRPDKSFHRHTYSDFVSRSTNPPLPSSFPGLNSLSCTGRSAPPGPARPSPSPPSPTSASPSRSSPWPSGA